MSPEFAPVIRISDRRPDLPGDIRAFFDAYRDAFNALDGDRIAALYAVPSGIAQAGVFTYWDAAEPIRRNMHELCDLYRGRGYREAHYEAAAFIAQGSDYAVADLRWRIDWTSGADAWAFNTTYNLVRTAQGWKVLVCTAYAEDKLFGAAPDGT